MKISTAFSTNTGFQFCSLLPSTKLLIQHLIEFSKLYTFPHYFVELPSKTLKQFKNEEEVSQEEKTQDSKKLIKCLGVPCPIF